MNTTSKTTDFSAILANAKDNINTLERRLNAKVLLGENFVVGFAQYGLFLNGAKQLGSVVGASCYTLESATAICADDNIKNGNGEVAAPVALRDAMKSELRELQDLVAAIEAA